MATCDPLTNDTSFELIIEARATKRRWERKFVHQS